MGCDRAHCLESNRVATLGGVIATAGRWIKLLAVAGAIGAGARPAPSFSEPRATDGCASWITPATTCRPGSTSDTATRRAFFAARGFRETGEVENIRAPLEGNLLVGRT